MKILLTALLAICTICTLQSQTYKISYGNEIRLRKGTTDLDIVYADPTGLYFTESRVSKTSFTGPMVRQTLMKFDKNYSEVFDKEYKKELKGLDFNGFQPMGDEIFLFATDYIKKDKLFKAYGARLDKNSGELMGDFLELGNFQLESKRDHYDMKMTPIRDGSKILMVTNISGKEYVSLGVSILDKKLRIEEDAVIDLALSSKEFNLQDVKYTADNKIIVLGKQFEEVQVGRKKRKRMVFKQFVMMIYSKEGRKEKNIVLESGDRFVISGQLIEQQGTVMLAGFYSNTSKKSDLSGFFINRINTPAGVLELASYKEINAGMLGADFSPEGDDDEDESDRARKKREAKEKKEEDEEEDLPNQYIIKSVLVNPTDQSIIITSEHSTYRYQEFASTDYSNGNRVTTFTEVHQFTNKDILVICADKNGQIKWLNAIPKLQREVLEQTTTGGSGVQFLSNFTGYFAHGGGFPYYSSFSNMLVNDKLIIFVNDHPSNNVNPRYGDKVKGTYHFKNKSNVYGIAINLATGDMNRKVIASNSSESILMPRHGYVMNGEIVIPSWRMKMIGKTELKFARITVLNR